MSAPLQDRLLSRRAFTAASLNALFVGMAVTMGACGSSGDSSVNGPSSTPSSSSQTGDKSAVIGSNHGHVAVITGAQLGAGNAVTIDISGSAGHPHTVSITLDDVRLIAAGTRVTKTSSTDAGHDHSVTFN